MDTKKDINYFLNEEDKYNQIDVVNNVVWFDEIQECDYKNNKLDFLHQRPFHRSFENIKYFRDLTKGYDLSDAELTLLGLFFMHHSKCFRDDYYGDEIPQLAKNMFVVLDNAISKAPKTVSTILYRFCVEEDKRDMVVGSIISFPWNLTCTIDEWKRKDRNIYIINTLSQDKTNAHDTYMMYPHNTQEKQVNFMRGTRFYVTKVEKIEGTEYQKFYMRELEDKNIKSQWRQISVIKTNEI